MGSSEQWIDIKGYEGYYKVSNLGRVKSVERLISYNHSISGYITRTFPEKILYPRAAKNGYMKVTLSTQDKGAKKFTIHRLVAEAFIENPEDKPTVNHKDGNKENNKVDNLEWSTISENIKHAYNSNLMKSYDKGRDSIRKKIDMFDLQGNLIKTFDSIKEACEELSLTRNRLKQRLEGRNYKENENYIVKLKENV